jgi:isopenicillin N synthase-like dioxygenase
MLDVRQLEEKGRLYVHYPQDLRDAVLRANDAWVAFCALPEDQKLKFPYSEDKKVSGNGYELKKDLSTGDLKEDFHLRMNVADWLKESALQVDDTITPTFVEAALAIPPLMAPILKDFAESVEKELDIKGFMDDVMSMQPRWLIRFLHYFGDRQPGDEIAAPHVDKGGFTLHLYESHPGVEQLDYATKEWVPMPLSHEDTVIIPAMSLQNRTKNALRATCHRVVATEETAKIGRFSAVAFFNFANSRFYDKQTFGRLQNYAPGFFYDMPFEKFDEYFVD